MPAEAVTLENWMRPPYNVVGYQRIRELIPTAVISRGEGPAFDLEGGGSSLLLRGLADRTHTDALVVLHRGRVIHEQYENGMGPGTRHLCMSVSKSITATAVGSVIASGALSPDDEVCAIVPEFRGTGLEGATVRHVLDMRTGTREDITTLELQRAYYSTCLWAPPASFPESPGEEDSRSHLWRLTQVRPHGGDFEYRSTLTCVLAILAERATGLRLPELVSQHLWQRLGAEHDAEITVDRNGNALADIGICCTARDLARLGEVLRRGGRRPDGARVVPEPWVADTLSPDAGQPAAFTRHGSAYLDLPGAYYRNQWWVADKGGIYLALGIHGQLLFVHEKAEVVIAKFSSWPEPWIEDLARTTVEFCMDISADICAN
ncbi:serine hydrolase domain-containing protein [Nonomuraea angiospora]|uniref:CubicO group peptidase (Beta-lactamase class C family) n=1 Tax=Nonomuraea angiospora TaxID=46172 RepID=A0ABR9ML53_9ACTN|nr:serine hydrolase [Nonomuraea angiospora]MBE1593290.1 CubicO group peptidase (beta-lactamase class C family) [Nonomuraea angiospora]